MKTNLGDKVKDVVTGFEGIAVAKTRYLNQPVVLVAVQSTTQTKDGVPVKEQWFNQPMLDVIKAGAIPPRELAADANS